MSDCWSIIIAVAIPSVLLGAVLAIGALAVIVLRRR